MPGGNRCALATCLASNEEIAGRDGPIVMVHGLSPDEVARSGAYPLDLLMLERSTSTNTAAAGGNASLMSIG